MSDSPEKSEISGVNQISRVNPWRDLWLRPGPAVEAALAQKPQWRTLVIAAFGTVLNLFKLIDDSAPGFGGLSWQFDVFLMLGGAVSGILLLYAGAFFLNLAARLLGGKGTSRGLRAALAWSSVPGLIGLVLTLAANSAGLAKTGQTSWLWFCLDLLLVLGLAWSFILTLAMVARVQSFGRVRAFASYVLGVAVAGLGLAYVLKIFVVQPFDAPGASMTPALLKGDHFFVSKFAYGYSRYSFPFEPASLTGRILPREPQRGDVVVFRRPRSNIDYVRRIIGLPGDKIYLRSGRLYLNGVLVERTQLKPGDTVAQPSGQSRVEVPAYLEHLPGGVTYKIIEMEGDRGLLDNTEIF